jgi:hypothetical protein
MFNKIIGETVLIRANDFINKETLATIDKLDNTGNKLLLLLNEPLLNANERYLYAIAEPRLSKDALQNLIDYAKLGCNLTWIPQDRMNCEKPFDISWWRGGAVAIADICICK